MSDRAAEIQALYEAQEDLAEEQAALRELQTAQICKLLGYNRTNSQKLQFRFLLESSWGKAKDIRGAMVVYDGDTPVYIVPETRKIYINAELGLVGWLGAYFYVFRAASQIPDSDIAKIRGAGKAASGAPTPARAIPVF